MKKGSVFSLLAVLAIVGCQTKELDLCTQESKHFTATIEDGFAGGDTRTYMDENGNVRWKQGDQVSIFAGSTVNEQYQVTDASNGKTAAAFNKVSGGGFVGGGEIDNNVAFYPYASTAEIAKSGSSYVISDISLPATQNYAEASFGNGAFPMSAVTTSTTDMHLKFKNILGGLKLQLKGTASIASISITGNQDEILCGAAAVTVSNGSVPSINLTDASAKTVTLDCGTGVQLNAETATPFVIALPPMTMEGGFTVVVTDTEGKQMEIKTTKTQTINRSSLLKMPAVNYVVAIDYASEPLSFTSIGSTSVSLTQVGTPYEMYFEYKKGDGDWTAYTIDSAIELSDRESLQFRQRGYYKGRLSRGSSNRYTFQVEGSGNVTVSGNIMSLLDGSLETGFGLTYGNSGFCELFRDCINLVDASNLILPATTLPSAIYLGMFRGCTSLITAPELPATTLSDSCYSSMFYGCSSLTTAPDLPATTLAKYCYSTMFSECSSLTVAPELPATTVAMQCYYGMFWDCSSLTVAPPILPASTLDQKCYMHMFEGCSSLVNAPKLPATTLDSDCYREMFRDCTSLITPPELPATTLTDYCYYYMFYGCTNLITPPVLPATSLAISCYYGMFQGCTSLTVAPDLPAISLVSNCYVSMFRGCSSLNYVKALFTTEPSYSYTGYWLSGVSSTGTFVKSKDATWDVTGLYIPSGWTVLTE